MAPVKDTPMIPSPSNSLMFTSPALSTASSLSSSGFDFVNVKQQLDSERLAGAGAIRNARLRETTGEESSFSDDEIVWTVSESEDASGAAVLSDDDFVVLARSSSQRSTTKKSEDDNVTIHGTPHNLTSGLQPEDRDSISSEFAKEVARLYIDADGGLVGEASGSKAQDSVALDTTKSSSLETATNKGMRKKRRKEKQKVSEKRVEMKETEGASNAKDDGAYVSTDYAVPVLSKSLSQATIVPCTPQLPAAAPAPTPLKKKKKKVKAKKEKTVVTSPAIHPTPVSSEKVSEQSGNPTAYDEAVTYITSYIANPTAHTNQICHLTLLQSLIIELGLLTDIKLLPTTIKSAKKYIKPRVFLNIRDYLSKRLEGPQAVRNLMFPSRSALVRDVRKKKNHASLKWVKKRGLQDLLVSVFH